MIKSLKKIFNNECPNCSDGKVFRDKNFFFSIGFPKMNSICVKCNFKFDKEPGFFVGAMYVSYGLSVGQALCVYFITSLFFDKALDLRIIPVIMVAVVLFSFFNIRLSRMIWLYMFKNYSR